MPLRTRMSRVYHGGMPETDDRRKSRWLASGGLAVCLAVVAGLVVQDPGGSRVLAECLALGEGRFFGELPEGQFEVDYFGNSYIGTPDNMIDRHVFVMGGWERQMLAAMEDMLELTVPGGGVVVDIGANVGTHSIYLSNHAERIHAIEPWPTVLHRLEGMLEASEIDNVVVHPVGFSEERGTLPFTLPPAGNLGAGSFSTSLADQRDFGEKTIDLPLVVADDYLHASDVEHVDMVKIDIEGYEKGALRGMRQTLVRDRPVVFLELNVENEEGFHSEEELRSVFPARYVFFELEGPTEYMWEFGETVLACSNHAGRYRLRPLRMVFDRDGRNVVAMPAEVAERLDELPDRADVSR